VSSVDGQYWPKHVKAKLLLITIKLVTLDGFLMFIYELRVVTLKGLPYKDVFMLLITFCRETTEE
jgi:hypothetical protein